MGFSRSLLTAVSEQVLSENIDLSLQRAKKKKMNRIFGRAVYQLLQCKMRQVEAERLPHTA